jgi:hypothetical protein
MSKIIMLETQKGSTNGIKILVFESGVEYTIGDGITQRLADVFVSMRIAKKVIDEPEKKEVIDEPEQKGIDGAPINKAISSAPVNKETIEKPKWTRRRK